MTRVVAHESWLKTLGRVIYHKHIGNGYWLADVELQCLARALPTG